MAMRHAPLRGWRRMIGWALLCVIAGSSGFLLWRYLGQHPADLPWTRIDLKAPIGYFTPRKLAELGEDFAACRAALDSAGVRYRLLPATGAGACRRAQNLTRLASGPGDAIYLPNAPAPSCSVQAALLLWEREVVQPAARSHFGRRVTRITHLGVFNCRRIGGGERGAWSEHARGNAIDIAGFTLADGREISLLRDWDGDDPAKAEFLRVVREGSCRLFASVLSPDYNAAHANHFHFDMADRGRFGWRVCR